MVYHHLRVIFTLYIVTRHGDLHSIYCPARSEVVAFLPADGMSEQDMMPDLVLAALAVLTNLAIRGDLRARIPAAKARRPLGCFRGMFSFGASLAVDLPTRTIEVASNHQV